MVDDSLAYDNAEKGILSLCHQAGVALSLSYNII